MTRIKNVKNVFYIYELNIYDLQNYEFLPIFFQPKIYTRITHSRQCCNLYVYGEVPSIQSTLKVDFRLYDRHLE